MYTSLLCYKAAKCCQCVTHCNVRSARMHENDFQLIMPYTMDVNTRYVNGSRNGYIWEAVACKGSFNNRWWKLTVSEALHWSLSQPWAIKYTGILTNVQSKTLLIEVTAIYETCSTSGTSNMLTPLIITMYG